MKYNTVTYSLRTATNEDLDFMFQLRRKTMKPFFENTIGWEDSKEFEKAIDELFNAKIVMVNNEKSGVLKIVHKTDELHLHQMQIEPKYQNHGLGSELIRNTISQSESLHLPITLFVINSSPAKCLYARFGFVMKEDYGHYCKMIRRPDDFSSDSSKVDS